jgi:hypothetical protein
VQRLIDADRPDQRPHEQCRVSLRSRENLNEPPPFATLARSVSAPHDFTSDLMRSFAVMTGRSFSRVEPGAGIGLTYAGASPPLWAFSNATSSIEKDRVKRNLSQLAVAV